MEDGDEGGLEDGGVEDVQGWLAILRLRGPCEGG